MGFFRQEHWSGLPFSSSGDLPGPGIKPASPVSLVLQVDFLQATRKVTGSGMKWTQLDPVWHLFALSLSLHVADIQKTNRVLLEFHPSL